MSWEYVRLGDYADVRDGTHDSPKYVADGYPLITSKNIIDGKIDFNEVNLISEEDYNKINGRSKVDIGDILMPMIGTIGNPALITEAPAYAIKNVALIKFNNSNLLNRYLLYVLKSSIFEDYKTNVSRGGTQKFLSLSDLRNFTIPLPPIEIQEKISNLLGKVTQLIEKRREQINLLETLTQDTFLDIFGDPIRNPMGWQTVTIEEKITKTKNINSKTATGFIRYIDIASVDNVTKQVIGTRLLELKDAPSRAKKIIYTGDILVSTVRPNLNAVALIDIEDHSNLLIASTGFCVLRCTSEINNRYLFQICKSKHFIEYLSSVAKGASYPAVSEKDIWGVNIMLPPIELQNDFANKVLKIEKQKALLQTSLEELETIYKASVQKAFNGELFN